MEETRSPADRGGDAMPVPKQHPQTLQSLFQLVARSQERLNGHVVAGG